MKEQVIAALREQVAEADRHIGEPGYNIWDCERNARAFGDVADWLTDNWDDIVQDVEAL